MPLTLYATFYSHETSTLVTFLDVVKEYPTTDIDEVIDLLGEHCNVGELVFVSEDGREGVREITF